MSVDVTVTAPGCCEAHSHNLTYNYTPALREAGFPSWKMLDNLRADVVALMLGRLRIELNANRARYEPLIRGNGQWGTWDSMMESLEELQKSLDTHAEDGWVRVT